MEVMDALNASMEAFVLEKPLVGMWMDWMGIVMIASLLFVWKHIPARWVLGSLLPLMAIALVIFDQTSNLHLLGIAHFFVWIPLLWHLWKVEFSKKGFKVKSAYTLWLVLLAATMLISLAFDVRDVVLVLMGAK